jgi:hypothetical protein
VRIADRHESSVGTVLSSLEPLPGGGDDGSVGEIVDRHVRSLIDWYQRKKRWPRRLHRATAVAVILLGAAIPLLSISEPSGRSQIVTSAVGVTISGLTGLATVTDWQRRWQIFTSAQAALEVRLADWEMSVTEAALVEPERGRQMTVDATRTLLAAATTIRLSETEEFFLGQPQVTGTAAWQSPAGGQP